MAKPPHQRECGQDIDAQRQHLANLHRCAEEGHRVVLEQAMERHITDEDAQRAIFDQALQTQLRAVRAHRVIIERALDKTRSIAAEHQATLQRALSRTHRNGLAQGLLKLPEAKRSIVSARKEGLTGDEPS